MKNLYKKVAIEHYVKGYLEENNRVPSQTEINQFLVSFAKANPAINTYGMSSDLTKKYSFLEGASAKKANSNFEAIRYDLKCQDDALVDFIKRFDISKYSLKSYLRRTSDSLSKIENRLNSLLINYSNSDIFLHSIEEDFRSHEKIDLKNSTASAFNGYCTLDGKADYYDISDLGIFYRFRSKNKRISVGSNVEIKEILENNGKDCIIEYVTTQRVGRVVLEVTLDLKEIEGRYVGSTVIMGSSVEKNSKMYYGTEIEVGTKAFRAIEPRIKRFSSGENFTNINEKNVKRIRFSFIKEAADKELGSNTYAYVFNLSKIKIRKDSFDKSYGELFAGPYEVVSETGEKIDFSMAKLSTDTCCIVPEKTSVNFYISVNNEDWRPVNFTPGEQNIVKFNTLSLTSEGEKIKETEDRGKILFLDGEYFINYRIKSSFISGINKNNISIKRNIAQGLKLYGANNGWFFDPKKEVYKCAVEIENLEGKYLDIGPNSMKVDGFIKSGLIKLSQGYHFFEIDSDKYFDVESMIDTENKLMEADPHYPYNMKHLIQGYNYPNVFDGDKVYRGLGSVYSFSLNYIPVEKFDIYNSLDGYTVIEKQHDGEIYSYFKVNVDLSDSSWRKELSDIEITGSSKLNNKLYIKAIIRSSEPGRVPHINSFNVRVI